jgi:hypothetical protein
MKANVPGLSMHPVIHENPFVALYIPGDKLYYETLDFTFLVDEDYRSWQSIHDWIRGLTFPTGFSEYANLMRQQRFTPPTAVANFPQYSDAQLSAYSNKNNPTINFKFRDCFPVDLSSIDFDTQSDADTIITAKASFRFGYYDIERV